MNYLHLLCFICVGFRYVLCAPAEPPTNTFYSAIIEKCPKLDLDANYKKLPLFRVCSNWKNISEVNTVTPENVGDIRCLLYYETFTSYCSDTQNVNTTVSKSILDKYQLDDVCAYVKTNFKHLGTLFSTQDNCNRICSDDLGYTLSICSTSYYFAHLKQAKVETLEEVTSSSTTNPTHHEMPPNHLLLVHHNKSVTDNKNITFEKKKSGDASLLNNVAINAPPPVVQQESAPEHETGVKPPVQPALITVKPAIVPVNPKEPEAPVVAPNQPSTNVDKPKTEEKSPKTVDIDQDIQNTDRNQSPVIANSEMDPDDEIPEGLDDENLEAVPNSAQSEKNSKPLQGDDSVSYATEMEGDSYFFTYFMLLCIIFIVGYVCYHNKQKILALILEGRKGKRQYRGRRPNSANYHKLDSNLEEAISSSCTKNTNNVIY